MVIYKITNKINDKIYIGQTKDSKQRIKQHSKIYKNNRTSLIDKSIQKYGVDNFDISILKECKNEEDLNYWESYFIDKYNSMKLKIGYNLKGGGAKPFLTKEIKEKIGKAQKGKLNHMYGKTGKENLSSKPLINMTTNKIYECVSQCAKEENKSFSHIAAVCRGERGTCGGCVYRYLDKNGKILEPKKIKPPHRKAIKCIETGIVYLNCNDAKRKLGHEKDKHNQIHSYFHGKRKTAYGYNWIYC